MWIGDYAEDHTSIVCMFTTHAATGAPVAPSDAFEAADIKIYKNGNAAEKTTTNGVTMTSPFDSITGLHCVTIDTSIDTGDGGFWAANSVYTIVLSPDETVDSVVIAKVLGQFGITLAGAGSVSPDPDIAAIKAKTDQLTFTTTNRVDSQVFGMQADTVTASAIAADAIGASELDASAVTEIQAGIVPLDAAGVRAAIGLAAPNLDTQLDALPTAVETADTLLDRDMSAGTDSGSTTVRTPRQALRFLRNKWSVSGTTLTVTKENDATASWTATVTQTAGSDPITASDPAGP